MTELRSSHTPLFSEPRRAGMASQLSRTRQNSHFKRLPALIHHRIPAVQPQGSIRRHRAQCSPPGTGPESDRAWFKSSLGRFCSSDVRVASQSLSERPRPFYTGLRGRLGCELFVIRRDGPRGNPAFPHETCGFRGIPFFRNSKQVTEIK